MNVLLTSGGTKIPIDEVRSITNMSNGTFGAKLAESLILYTNAEITFLMAKHSASPCKVSFDIRLDPSQILDMAKAKLKILDRLKSRKESFRRDNTYTELEYTTFDEYRAAVHKTIYEKNPDVIILAAAVSDYGTAPKKGKIRSSEDLKIEMQALPKVISEIRKDSPHSILVGFKLLVNSSLDELISEARKSIKNNGCDLVVANDWRDLKAGNHTLYVVDKNDVITLRKDEQFGNQAAELTKIIEGAHRRMRVERFGG